jgi:hypothetical protein
MMQGYHNSDETICAYANQLWRNWSEAGCDEELHNIILYNMIWAELKPYHHPTLRPCAKANGRFDFVDQHFDTAADFQSHHGFTMSSNDQPKVAVEI